MHTTQLPPSVQMLHLVSGFWASRSIYTIAKLGLADVFKAGSQTPQQVATQTQTHASSVYRLLRAAASIGLFTENEAGAFDITELGRTLMSDIPGSQRDFVIAELGQEHYTGWGNLPYSVQTGEIAFNNMAGKDIWAYYAEHPEDGHRFINAMSNLSNSFNSAILHSYDFSQFKIIVDVGGAAGALLGGILHQHTAVKGIVFDLPHVVEYARAYIQHEGLAGRCSVEAGDFFASVPEGGDAYLLKFILHDWNDETALKILKNCHQAMPDKSKLLVFESVIPTGNDPHLGKLLDINMLVMTGGVERTATHFDKLLGEAGFKIQAILPTPSPLNIIECVKR